MTEEFDSPWAGGAGEGGGRQPDQRESHGRVRKVFFVGSTLAGWLIALGTLVAGVIIDAGAVPFGAWSLLLYLLGGCLCLLVGAVGSKLYRRYRRRSLGPRSVRTASGS